jgi:hypothetical protein
VLGAALLAALGWASVLAAAPAAMVWLGGAGGVAPSLGPWDSARLALLALTWCAMLVAMALPCSTLAAVLNPVRQQPLGWQLARLACFALGGAVSQWMLESVGMLEATPMRIALLAAGLAFEIVKWHSASRHFTPALQMVCLQLLWPTSLLWMAIAMLWMLADALRPEHAVFAAAASGRRA